MALLTRFCPHETCRARRVIVPFCFLEPISFASKTCKLRLGFLHRQHQEQGRFRMYRVTSNSGTLQWFEPHSVCFVQVARIQPLSDISLQMHSDPFQKETLLSFFPRKNETIFLERGCPYRRLLTNVFVLHLTLSITLIVSKAWPLVRSWSMKRTTLL